MRTKSLLLVLELLLRLLSKGLVVLDLCLWGVGIRSLGIVSTIDRWE